MPHIFLVMMFAVGLATPYLPFQYALPILPWLLHLRSGEAHTMKGKPLLLIIPRGPEGKTLELEWPIAVFYLDAAGQVTWVRSEKGRRIDFPDEPYPEVEPDTELAERLSTIGAIYSDHTMRMAVRFREKDLTVSQLIHGLRRLKAAAAKGGVGLAVELKPK